VTKHYPLLHYGSDRACGHPVVYVLGCSRMESYLLFDDYKSNASNIGSQWSTCQAMI